MREIQTDRLNKLREARRLVERLEDNVESSQAKPAIWRIRGDIERAGSSIQSAGFNRAMQSALGRIAGIATANKLDGIADEATLVLDRELDEIDPETIDADASESETSES